MIQNFSLLAFSNTRVAVLNDNRSCFSKFFDSVLAISREIRSRYQRRYNPLRGRIFPIAMSNAEGAIQYCEPKPWISEPKNKLVVFIHGLNSSPLAWGKYILHLEKEYAIFAPQVHQKGYCALEEAAAPILAEVQSYAHLFPDNPIFLVGHSNGGRIAAYLEQKLIARRITLISIAGPHSGTALVNRLQSMRALSILGISRQMALEFEYQGNWALRNLIDWQNDAILTDEIKKVKRIFYATADDGRIYPFSSSFPNLPNSAYYLLRRHSHVTIIDAVQQHVCHLITEEEDADTSTDHFI